ncbi:MAG: thioredoxin family protein [Vicinamibacterales bacterium]
MTPMSPRWACALLFVAVTAVDSAAQLRRPRAEVVTLAETDVVRPGSSVRLAVRVTLPEGLHVQSDAPKDPSLIPTVLTLEPPAGVAVTEIVFPEATDFAVAGIDEPLKVFEHEFYIGIQVAVASTVPDGQLALPATLRYQACNDQLCFAPATAEAPWHLTVAASQRPETTHAEVFAALPFGTGKAPAAPASGAASAVPGAREGDRAAGARLLDGFAIQATAGGYLATSDFLDFVRDAESGTRQQGMFEGRGPLAILLLVLIGGLALNLTPCVLPMIPINLAIIGAGAQAGSRQRGFLLGATYGSAMAVVYGVLGLVVILTASTFGIINASPWFNLVIAAIFVVLALAMFDVIVIDFSSLGGRFRPGAGRGSFALAFTMGTVAALLAGACVAPVVIQVVLFASNLHAAGNASALALPFVLGVGMAIPWPIAGAGLSALPKPGPWMTRVKHAFGVLILGTSVYYGYLAYELFANRMVDPDAVSTSVEDMLKSGWNADLAEGLSRAAQDGRPVLIDLWATWCKNCLTMDKTTFADPAVTGVLSRYVKIKFQAEDPDEAVTKAVMQRFGAVGLPTYVILKPKSTAGN